MSRVLNDIKRLRGKNEINIDRNNNHRNRVILNEKDGTKTAYYFSSPIYNIHTKKLVDFRFNSIKDMLVLEGTNSKTVIDENIDIIGLSGSCRIRTSGKIMAMTDQEITYDGYSISPTSNGVAYCAKVNKEQPFQLKLEVTNPFLKIMANDRCFALMIDEFVPLLTVSCAGTINESGQIIAPAAVEYQKIHDRSYEIWISSCLNEKAIILFEINMYEKKLVQDTTVESTNPILNNAFGTVSFLGRTEKYGEQWLYIRPQFSSLSELIQKREKRVTIHFPILGGDENGLVDLFMIRSRFCSFGSTWNNKIEETNLVSCGRFVNGYLSFDITNYLDMNGLVVKPRSKTQNAIVVATGDSYWRLPILEINYI